MWFDVEISRISLADLHAPGRNCCDHTSSVARTGEHVGFCRVQMLAGAPVFLRRRR